MPGRDESLEPDRMLRQLGIDAYGAVFDIFTAGALGIVRHDGDVTEARCRDPFTAETYELGHNAAGWHCSCGDPERPCAHMTALAMVLAPPVGVGAADPADPVTEGDWRL